MNKFYALFGTGLFLSASLSATCLAKNANQDGTSSSEQGRPNIVWIVTEDQSNFIPGFGDATIKTPNLTHLADEGIRFTDAYSVSGVCAPSRAALITGMYPTSIGADNMRVDGSSEYRPPNIPAYSIVPPPQVKFYSELLRKAGYYTINNGKTDYQIEKPITSYGNTHIKDQIVTAWDENYRFFSTEDFDAPLWRDRPKGHPFFEAINLDITHEHEVWARAGMPMLVDPEKVPVPPMFPDTPTVRKDLARNYSNLKIMDRQVGKILARLKHDGVLHNTIVFFFSDQGGPFPRYKRSLYDTGLKVPLIVRFPDKRRAGTTNSELVSFVDFAPTLLSLAHVPIPGFMQGQAFLGNQKSKTPRRYVYGARDRLDTKSSMSRAVRGKRFQYLRNYESEKPYPLDLGYRKKMAMMRQLLKFHREGKLKGVQKVWFHRPRPVEELYDTKQDPYELNNLVNNSTYKAQLQKLRGALNQWERKTRDLNFTPEKQLVDIMWPNGKQPVTKAVLFSKDKDKETVTITSPTEGASIAYRFVSENTSTSNKHKVGSNINQWKVYTDPLHVPAHATIQAVAVRYGYKKSTVKSFSAK